jgi:DNA-binding beta-propeller fold protein YncE
MILAGALAAARLFGQQNGAATNVGAPTLGYVFDRLENALRPIQGVPGAALTGAPLALGFAAVQAAVSGDGEVALLVSRGTLEVNVVNLRQPTAAGRIPIPGRAAGVYLSPRGSAAAIVDANRSLVLVSGLTSSMVVGQPIPIGGFPSAVALTDDGNFAIVAFSGVSELLVVGQNGSRFTIPTPGLVSVLAFAPGSDNLLASGPDNTVWLIRQATSNPALAAVAGSGDGIASAAALAFTSDGKTGLVANAGNGTIAILDLTTGTTSAIPCACVPAVLDRLAAPGWFRLNEASDGPLWVLDANSGRILFVPPPADRARGKINRDASLEKQ